MRGSLDHCVKCTICETQCPVSNVTPLFPGPKYAGPQAERYRIADEPSVDSSVDYCSGCGICSMVVSAGREDRRDQLPGAQQAQAPEGYPAPRPDHHSPDVARPRGNAGGAARQLHDRFSAGPDPRGEAAQDSPRCGRAGLRRPALLALVQTAPGPADRARIVYFHGCGTEYYEPWEGEKVVAILEHNGFEVVVPKQDCCGLPLQSSGLFDDARKVVLRLARNLAPYVRDDPDTIIVGNATSCTLMLKREAREILSLEDDPDLKLRVRAHLRHLRAAARAARPRRAQDRLHPGQRAHLLPRALPAAGPLDRQARARAVRADPGSQGHARATPAAAGSPGPMASRPRSTTSRWRSARDLFEQVEASGAGEVACDSETCRWQISHATGQTSVHPIDYLHRAYGL